MRRNILAGLILILVTVFWAACGDDDSTSDPNGTPGAVAPTEAPEATDAPEPTEAPDPADLGKSRDNAVPRGTSLLVPEGWELTVVDFTDDADSLVQAENQFNDPAEAGYKKIIIRVRAKNVSAEDDPADFDARFALRLVGSENVGYSTFERACGVIPDSFSDLSGSVFAGGEIEANICFQVLENETDFAIFTEFFLGDDDDSRWFAVQ